MLGDSSPTRAAVDEMLQNNEVFYEAFGEAWEKATKVGQQNLSPLSVEC